MTGELMKLKEPLPGYRHYLLCHIKAALDEGELQKQNEEMRKIVEYQSQLVNTTNMVMAISEYLYHLFIM